MGDEFYPALRIKSDIEMYFDFHVDKKFIFFFNIDDATFTNTEVIEALIPMYYHPYDALFDAIMEDLAYNWNYTHQLGIDLKNYISLFKAINAGTKSVTLSPYVVDGFMYGGFSLVSDFGEEADVETQ